MNIYVFTSSTNTVQTVSFTRFIAKSLSCQTAPLHVALLSVTVNHIHFRCVTSCKADLAYRLMNGGFDVPNLYRYYTAASSVPSSAPFGPFRRPGLTDTISNVPWPSSSGSGGNSSLDRWYTIPAPRLSPITLVNVRNRSLETQGDIALNFHWDWTPINF